MTRIRSVIGTSLSLLLAAAGSCAMPVTAIAAQSDSFMLNQAGDEAAVGSPMASNSYQLQGDLTWTQEAPLHSTSFQITTAPPAPAISSAPATSSAPSNTSDGSSDTAGGHRGEGTTTTNPPASHASSEGRSSAASLRASSASSVASAGSSASAVSSEDASVASSAVSSVLSGASSEEGRPAAPDETYQESRDPACRLTILCADPYWHPIQLTPSGSGSVREGPSVVDVVHATITACTGSYTSITLSLLCFLIGCLVTALFFSVARRYDRMERVAWYATLAAAGLATVAFFCVQSAQAAVSSPQRHVYNGHLLNASGEPITTAHYIRFSEWYSRDMDPTDVVSGVIDTGAATYAGYQEVHVVTPDSQGYFSVELGSGASLPNLADVAADDLDNLFLQVEVKAAGNPDTAYELLDVNPSDDAVDRSPILSVPFAQNADLLDQREIGTGSGAIPLLGSGGKLAVPTVPGGTNEDSFTIDADNTAASEITLTFGQALAETLKYDIANDRFTFSADLRVEGDLVVTGLINGVDISAISGSDDGKLRVSSGAGLTVNVTGGNYRLNGTVVEYTGDSGVSVAPNATNYVFIGSGGLTVRTSGYPTDESFIRLATVITDGSGVTQVNDGRVILSDDRELPTEVNMHAEFQNASYQADATDNVGQLSVSLDNITQRNFYLWTSTRTTLQDYDVVVRVTLPADFVRWDNAPLAVSYRTTSADAANSKVDVSVFDTNGTPVTLGGGATGLASTSWGTANLTYDTGATWTAGSDFLLKFKVYAKDDFQAHIGSIKLKYVRLSP